MRPLSSISPERLNGLTILLRSLLTLLTVGFAVGIGMVIAGVDWGAVIAWGCVLSGVGTLAALLHLTDGRRHQLKPPLRLTIDLLLLLTNASALLIVLVFLATAVLKIAGL